MASYSTTVTKRDGLSAAPEDAQTLPHHVRSADGSRTTRFKNPYPSWGFGIRSFSDFIRTFFWMKLTGRLPAPDTTPPTVTVRQPTFLSSRRASSKLRATWLGHACYYVEFPSGFRVLFDPVFEDRCSPFTFLGPKRFTPQPCDIADIPVIDAVVISHNHYDHLSDTTVREVHRSHPEATFFVGLGLEQWFRSAGIKKVVELDWWQDVDVTLTPTEQNNGQETKENKGSGPSETASSVASQLSEPITARISCLPSQHTSRRTPLDTDRTLWCSWAVSSATTAAPAASKSVWFGGDTGYRSVPHLPANIDDYGPEYDNLPRCPQFKQIGALREPFDLGLIPIGAYAPRFMFSNMHANPYDAVEIFSDARCRRAMGIHWGTWALTFEEVLEPPKLLRQALAKKGIPETGVFDVCEIGESREFE